MNSNKINNSYETESSSSSNSLISTTESLFKRTSFNNSGDNSLNNLYTISPKRDADFIIKHNFIEYNEELLEENLDNFDMYKNLYKKDNYVSSMESETISDQDISCKNDINNLLTNNGMFVNENSSNAVDNTLAMSNKSNLENKTSFDTLINKIVNQEKPVMIDITENINNNNQLSNYSKKSPNLFEEDIFDSSETINNVIVDKTLDSCNNSVNNNTIDIYENNLLSLIQNKFSGVLPPPSVTTTQLDISTMLSLYLKNIEDWNNNEKNTTHNIYQETHKINEALTIPWPKSFEAKSHGLCYNYSNKSENIELMCLKYCERYIGSETSTSYNFSFINSPTSTKKRAMRMKMLGQSPGRRLSHLARRRQFFSSITTVQTKSNSNLNLQSSNRQILVAKNGKNKLNQLPTTSDEIVSKSNQILLSGPSRETSKRALFQSPPKNTKPFNITPELADRVGKSKRVLFSPPKNIATSFNDNLNNKIKSAPNKRPSIDIIENKNKVRCTDWNSVLKNDDDKYKNSIKLGRSQSFYEPQKELKLTDIRSTRTIFRTSSDIVTSKTMSTTVPSNQILSDSHKKKLLWAVSQALQSKNINVVHENFKMYATTLARITKRLYIENIIESSSCMSSTSEKMLKLANRLAFFVIQGKTVDDVYQIEQKRLERIKSQKSFLNNKELGYITENDYNLLKNKINIDLNISQSSSNELDNNSNNKLSQDSNNTNTKLILRENVDFDKKPKSTQKHSSQSIFSGKDQKNIQVLSPIKSAKKLSIKKFHIENSNLGNINVLKAKRQISFDM